MTDKGYRAGIDREFGREFSWDIDMVTGYRYGVLKTRPNKPDLAKFRGARIGCLKQLFDSQGVSALLINGWMPQAYWQAAFQAFRVGIPVLLRAETNDIRQLPRFKEVLKREILRPLFDRISAFLCIGEANRRFYVKHGVPEEKLGESRYCVDNDRFFKAAAYFRQSRDQLRRDWQIPVDSICFLYAGKLIEKKRVSDLLKALSRIFTLTRDRGETRHPHLLVVGDGVLRSEVLQFREGLRATTGLSPLSFVGFLNQSEMPKAYAAADCLVLPSDAGETWGLVVNEAMACGLPTIVSDQVGCSPDLIEPGVTGDIFHMGHIESLVATMEKWMNPELRAAAHEPVLRKISDYSIGKAAGGIITALKKIDSQRTVSA